jgi:tRNA 2-thiouridine synthesizing protein A
MNEHTLDAKRLLCPMPVIRVQNTLNKLSVGDQLTVTCTDPGTLQDIPTWCRINGHVVVSTEHKNGEIIFVVKKQ